VSAVRVVVADDAVLLRTGVVSILADDGYDVVAAVGTGPELVAAALRHEPGLIVADVRMPPRHADDGIVAVREIRRHRPDVAVVLLSQYIEAERALDLFQDQPVGLGYLLKDRIIDIDAFLASVRRVAQGGSAIDPAVVSRLLGRPPSRTPPSTLTERELQVLALMAEGLSNAAIAERLHLGLRTVETHVNRVFIKLDVYPADTDHRRVKAVLAYLRAGR
jgi:DNA-binding NarL/FixJ family response regulator